VRFARFLFAQADDTPSLGVLRWSAEAAVDAAPSSIRHVVTLAIAAGATCDEIVATLEAVSPVTGAARVVLAAPKVSLALG